MSTCDTLTEIAMQADNSMAPHLTDNDELSPVDALARISKLAWAAVEGNDDMKKLDAHHLKEWNKAVQAELCRCTASKRHLIQCLEELAELRDENKRLREALPVEVETCTQCDSLSGVYYALCDDCMTDLQRYISMADKLLSDERLREAVDDSTKTEQPLPETGTPPCRLECELIDERSCGATAKGYTCSRNINHDGDHVACGLDHAYHVWPNEQSKIASGDVDKSRQRDNAKAQTSPTETDL